MGEAGELQILAWPAHAVAELQRRILCAQHEHIARHEAHLAVEEVVQPSVHLPQRCRGPRRHLRLARQHVVVDALQVVVGVVSQRAVSLGQSEEHRRHAPQAHPLGAAGEEVALCLLAEEHTRGIVGREVHRVAHHEMLGLDGGQHGIGPAERAAPLVFHR